MKPAKKIIYIAKHIPTNAEIPMIIKKVNKDNIIEEYSEHTDGRKGFTINMLQNRWDKCRDDVLELLQKYEIPAHLSYKGLYGNNLNELPINRALFFEEYIYAIENKEKITHSKLKSKKPEKESEH